MTGDHVLCKNWSLLGRKKLKPRQQNRMLVPFRSSFQNFQRIPRSFFIWTPTKNILPENVFRHVETEESSDLIR